MANLNSNADVRDEGNWDFTGWSPRLTTTGAMDTFVGLHVTRANQLLQVMVGLDWYAANAAADPWKTVLTAAEMDLAQALLLEAAAGIAESGSDTNPAPFLGTGATLLEVAAQRRANAELVVRLRGKVG